MLQTNLSTRPFYNVRAVRALLGLLAAVVALVTAFNVVQIVRLSAQQRTLGAQAATAEATAARLRADAAAINARIDPQELSAVAGEAREANAIIDQRTFSWTDLFTEFEVTLPSDVRIVSVRPNLGADGTFTVALQVEARQAEDLDAFIEALEMRGTFQRILPIEESTTGEGILQAALSGVYVVRPPDDRATQAPVAAPAATVPGDGR